MSVIWWGQIPSRVLARHGERRHAMSLSARFDDAIARAATGGGQAGSESYSAGWHQSHRCCSSDLVAEVEAVVADLERRFDDDTLAYLIRAARYEHRQAAHR
ncbi:MAG: virulence factor [Ornithinimicrobium sp.]